MNVLIGLAILFVLFTVFYFCGFMIILWGLIKTPWPFDSWKTIEELNEKS